MKKKDLKEMLKQEIESEASALERRVNTKKSLATLEMPEDSYEDLMERIKAKEKEKKESELESQIKPSVKVMPFPIKTRRKVLATVAMVVVLVVGAGLGVNGARLYLLKVEKQEGGRAFDIITDTEDVQYIELDEEDAYEKIEEELGILALRLTDRPKGLELGKVYIESSMGEALMEFYYDDHVLTIYENKQNSSASFRTQQDGVVIDTVEVFHLGKTLDIIEIDKGSKELSYIVQLEYGNAFYYLSSDIELDKLEIILFGIIFNNS